MIDTKLIIVAFIAVLFIFIIAEFLIPEKYRMVFKYGLRNCSSVFYFIVLIFIFNDRNNASIAEARDRVIKLNSFTNDAIMNLLNTLRQEPKELKGIYNEIFEDKPENGNPLTYHENLFLYQVFTTFLNLYRDHAVAGKEAASHYANLYSSWDNFIMRVLRSSKVRKYWNDNKSMFDSIDFIQFIDNKLPAKISTNRNYPP